MLSFLFDCRRWPVLRAALGVACAMPLASTAASPPLVGNVPAGQAAFKLCSSCHQVGPRAHAGFGPQLRGVIGRAAASTPDYRYSAAMQKSGIIWSEAKLAAFLRSPDAVVPGTRMRFWGLSDEQKIADLLAYLKSSAP